MIVKIVNMLIRIANNEGPDQTAPSGAVCSGSSLFAQPLLLISNSNFISLRVKVFIYSKTCVKRPLSKRPKIGFQDQFHLMQVKSIAECFKRTFCNTFDLH